MKLSSFWNITRLRNTSPKNDKNNDKGIPHSNQRVLSNNWTILIRSQLCFYLSIWVNYLYQENQTINHSKHSVIIISILHPQTLKRPCLKKLIAI